MRMSDCYLEINTNENLFGLYEKNINVVNEEIEKTITSKISNQKIFDENQELAHRLVAYNSYLTIIIAKKYIIILINETIRNWVPVININEVISCLINRIFDQTHIERKVAYSIKYKSTYFIEACEKGKYQKEYETEFYNEKIKITIKDAVLEKPSIEFSSETVINEKESYSIMNINAFLNIIRTKEKEMKDSAN